MLAIIAIAVVVIATYFAYKTANDNRRSGALWALITFGTGIGLQIVIPFVIGLAIAIYYTSQGVAPEVIGERVTGLLEVVGLVFLFLSLISMWLILKHVSKLPGDEPAVELPPPPTFWVSS